MRLKNINGHSAEELQRQVQEGGRFVYYQYTVSLLLVTFKRTSGVYLLKPGDKGTWKALPFTLISLLTGWWGIPVGPRYTIESILTNIRGGKDVTDDVMATVAGHLLFRETQTKQTLPRR